MLFVACGDGVCAGETQTRPYLGGGGGSINYARLVSDGDFGSGAQTNETLYTDYMYNAILGYRFRIKLSKKKTFFDIDLIVDMKRGILYNFNIEQRLYLQCPFRSVKL